MRFKLNDETQTILIGVAAAIGLAVLMSLSHYGGFTPHDESFEMPVEFEEEWEEEE